MAKQGLSLLIAAAAGFAAGFAAARLADGQSPTDNHVIILRDTVTAVSRPVATESTVTGRIVRRVASAPPTERADSVSPDTTATDSVTVSLPVSAVVYTGPGYYARVSGFEPRLDSIAVERVVPTVVATRPAAGSRWSLGITAGVGITPSGRVAPALVVGLTYRLR